MAKVRGKCRLCLRDPVDLRVSHILSKWVYRRILADLPAPKHHAQVNRADAFLTSKQLTDHLLCSDCEQRFGRWETVASGLVVQEDGSCPWATALKPVIVAPPVTVIGSMGDSSAVDTEAVTAFACSVIWRASVSDRLPKNSLGQYEEPFRKYLLGEAGFPGDAYLLVALLGGEDLVLPGIGKLATAPKAESRDGCDLHWFAVCGAKFDLFVGANPPKSIERACFVRTKRVSLRATDGFKGSVLRMLGSAVPKGKLARMRDDRRRR